MMKSKVSCNNCGYLLEIIDSTKFVTCNSCKSLLEIVNTENSIFTKERNDSSISLKQSFIPDKSNAQIYAEIDMLDRKWNNELPNYMTEGSLPYTGTGGGLLYLIGGIFIVGFGVFWTIEASSMDSNFGLFGVFFIGAGIFTLFNSFNKRNKFLEEKNKYERRRKELELKLKR